MRKYKIRSFGKEIIAQIVRDFGKFHSLIVHVETPPGARRRSSLLHLHVFFDLREKKNSPKSIYYILLS